MGQAPVLLFCYNRLDTLKLTVSALQNNDLACETDLLIFSDGEKNQEEKEIVRKIRSYLNQISGFKNVIIKESANNLGLANSIIYGVTETIKEYGKVIVVEDDLITSSNFLSYMNEALDWYDEHQNVFSISGYSFDLKIPGNYEHDVYFTGRSSSWGWATWKSRWDKVDWSMENYLKTKWTIRKILDFNKMGSDMYSMLRKQYKGKIDSWAIRFCFHQYLIGGYSVFPKISKVQNIGFGNDATHTHGINAFKTFVDETGKIKFNFCIPFYDREIIKQFTSKRSVMARLKNRISNLIQS